jgi:hypothetical protein
MAVNLEVKGALAKLLATENITIEHRKVDTASFDVNNRVLTFPMWENASSHVYDLLAGHEVGHALYTPNFSPTEWQKIVNEVPAAFINVVEDARVERLMKKKYPGISKSFYAGYSELQAKDFFSVKGKDINSLCFIDRINLYFKAGSLLNINFNDEEDQFITRISKSETFDDVLEICRDLVKYLKVKKIKVNVNVATDKNPGDVKSDQVVEGIQIIEDPNKGESDESDKSGDSDESDESGDSDESDDSGSSSVNGQLGKTGDVDEFNPITENSFAEKAKELINHQSEDPHYLELPVFDLNTLILNNGEIHKKISSFYTLQKEDVPCGDVAYHSNPNNSLKGLKDVDLLYHQYKKDSQKEVSYMIKEFECKKAADQHSRSSIAKTGVLNTSKLHTYKYSEDLFKKISVVPDGKSHGLIFILDWSGSMSDIIEDTCKQLYSLIWFCKKCQIPFDVYAFVENSGCYVDFQKNHPYTYERKENIIHPLKSFRLMHFFTSRTPSSVLEAQMKNIWRICHFLRRSNVDRTIPKFMRLGSTPLGEAIMALHQLIPNFINKTKVQKTHVVFLTDGDGNHCESLVKSTSPYRDFETRITDNNVVRNKRTGRVYPPYKAHSYSGMEKVILSTVKDSFPDVSLINFRIGYYYPGIAENHGEENWQKSSDFYNLNGYVTLTNGKYDQFHIIKPSQLSRHVDWKHDTKLSIAASFKNHMKAKKTNTKLINSFMSLIC